VTNLVIFLVAALVVIAPADHGPDGDWWGPDQVDRSVIPHNIPTWTPALERQYPSFADIDTKPDDVLPARLLVIDGGNDPSRMSFDEVWQRTHNAERADDVWVVGWRP
jgi:hypothetical protein